MSPRSLCRVSACSHGRPGVRARLGRPLVIDDPAAEFLDGDAQAHALLAQAPVGLVVVDAMPLHDVEHRLDNHAGARGGALRGSQPSWPVPVPGVTVDGEEDRRVDAARAHRLEQERAGAAARTHAAAGWAIRGRSLRSAEPRRPAHGRVHRPVVSIDEREIDASRSPVSASADHRVEQRHAEAEPDERALEHQPVLVGRMQRPARAGRGSSAAGGSSSRRPGEGCGRRGGRDSTRTSCQTR